MASVSRNARTTRSHDSARSSSASASSSSQRLGSSGAVEGWRSSHGALPCRAGRALAQRGSKRYEPHLPVYPPLPSTAAPVVLDPFPNTEIRSLCLSVDVLVTAHQNGLRMYKERRGEGCADGSGVWELRELRDNCHLRDAYLVTAIPPVLHDEGLLTTPYSRYCCVAAGRDHTTHSVCVISTAAHFNLHHELHGRNRIVALHFAQLALEPFQQDKLTPMVLSVDETGEVALFDVERNTAVKLHRCEGDALQTFGEDGEEGGERRSACPAYHLESGVATRAVLLGPCVELCNRCHNPFWRPSAKSAPSPMGSVGVHGTTPAAGPFLALGVLVASRARDVEAPPYEGANEPWHGAELGITFLRVLYSPSRAYVWHETDLVREVASADVCDAGVALYAPPYRVGHPTTALVGRPRLRVWRLSGCTGQLLQTQRIYDDAEGSGIGKRSSREFFMHWLPLGRHVLVQDSERRTSWSCVAAVTDDDTILLLGHDPIPARPTSLPDGQSGDVETSESCERAERRVLESWLEEVEVEGLPSQRRADRDEGPTAAPTGANRGQGGSGKDYTVLLELYSAPHSLSARASRHRLGKGGEETHANSSSRASSRSASSSGAHADGRKSRRKKHHRGGAARGDDDDAADAEPPPPPPRALRRRIQSVLGDLCHLALFVWWDDGETLLRIGLPFAPAAQARKGVEGAEEGRPPRGAGDTTDANAGSPSRGGGGAGPAGLAGDDGLWGSARRALSTTATSWLGLGGRTAGGAGREPSAPAIGNNTAPEAAPPPAPPAPAPAPAEEEEVRHGLGLMRPLAAVVFGGWGSSPLTPPTTTTTTASQSAPPQALRGSPNANDGGGSPPPARGPVPASWHAGDADVQGSSHSRSGADSPPPPSSKCGSLPRRIEAVRITLERPSRQSATARQRGPTSHTQGAGEAEDQGHLRRLYMQEQVQRVLAAEEAETRQRQAGLSNRSPSPSAAEQIAAQAERARVELVQREEPSARNTLLYAWQDRHNQLYIDFSLACDAMLEAAARRKADDASRAARERALYIRDVAATEIAEGGHSAAEGAAGRVGCHSSAQFTRQYHAMVDRRRRLCDRKGVFDFAAYFRSGVLPQQLVDLQERDKCRFELADLGIRQARELAGLDPVEVVCVYQNEERGAHSQSNRTGGAGAATGAWRPHPTFPYDDEDGSVADMGLWNSTADPKGGVGRYSWCAGEADAGAAVRSPAVAWGGAPGGGSAVRARAVTRELRDWELGPWEYASRWPSAEENRRRSFAWSSHEEPNSAVRRRQLSRRRVNLKVQAARERMHAEHQRQLEALRMELNL